MNERNTRIVVVLVDLFAAASAIAGAVGLVVGFMKIPLSVLNGTPFADFTIPAILLGFVVGGSALVAGLVAMFGPRDVTPFASWRIDALATAAAGSIMTGWIVIEVGLIGLGSWLQVIYFAVGLVMLGLAGLLQRAEMIAATPYDGRAGGRRHAAA